MTLFDDTAHAATHIYDKVLTIELISSGKNVLASPL